LYPQNASKRLAVRQIVLGPFFEGEDSAMEDEVMRPFEMQFLVDVAATEGFNPFYKEPVSRSSNNHTTANAAATATSPATTTTATSSTPTATTTTTTTTSTTHPPPKLTDEQSIALISVSVV